MERIASCRQDTFRASGEAARFPRSRAAPFEWVVLNGRGGHDKTGGRRASSSAHAAGMQQVSDLSSTLEYVDDLSERLLGWSIIEPSYVTAMVDAAGLEPGTRLLDAGCGSGVLLARAAFLEPSAVLVGIDRDEDSVTMARRRLASAPSPVEINHGHAERLPFSDGYFDVVCCSLVLAGLSISDRAPVLSECLRVLKPGGSIIAADRALPGCRLLAVAADTAASLAPAPIAPLLAAVDLDAELERAGFVRRKTLRTGWYWIQRVAVLTAQKRRSSKAPKTASRSPRRRRAASATRVS